MPNLTRDPFHPNTGEYIKNMNELIVKVDGVELVSKDVLNVYKTSLSEKPVRVEMLLRDDDGEIVYNFNEFKNRDVPETYDVEGHIVVIGDPSYCGCFKKRKIKHWWKRISDGYSSW